MTRGDNGWWNGPTLAHGQDYAFLVDGSGPFPDPRSPRQPYGVHGPSQAFDADAFAWTDAGWSGVDARGAVHYEVHVGTFTPQGTLDAAIGQLDRLAAIGIQLVELMPIAPMPGLRGWGYDGVSLYAVYEEYGGPEALQRFVDAAHSRGLAVALDVVYNHMGPDGNYVSQFGPYFTSAHHTPWGEAVNLDQSGSHEVRRFICDNALRWFKDFHIDALRLDAVHALRDDSEEHLLAQLARETAVLEAELGRPLSLIAESDLNDPALVTPRAHGGLGVDAQWNDDLHHALHAYLQQERQGYYVDFGSVDVLDKALQRVFVHDGDFSTFRGRDWGQPVPNALDRQRFVVFGSNHDQVGNRAAGDRPSASLSPGALATSLAVVLLSPFTPMLFMGEEYAETHPFPYFSDHAEPLGTAITKGRLAEFASHGWEKSATVPDPQSPATAASAVLDPTASGAVNEAIRRWFDAVIAARQWVVSREGWDLHPVSATEREPRQLTMTGPVRVHANLSPVPVTYEGRPLAVFGECDEDDSSFTLRPDAVALVRA